jgi:hypothetical protein
MFCLKESMQGVVQRALVANFNPFFFKITQIFGHILKLSV